MERERERERAHPADPLFEQVEAATAGEPDARVRASSNATAACVDPSRGEDGREHRVVEVRPARGLVARRRIFFMSSFFFFFFFV